MTDSLAQQVGRHGADIDTLKKNQTAQWSDIRDLRSDLDQRTGSKAAYLALLGAAGTLGALLSQLFERLI